MPRWEQLIAEIRRVETEILWLAPEREVEGAVRGGASEAELRAAEGRLGARLPPTYRAFLGKHDGWPCFFEGVTLLGTSHLGRRLYEDMARSVFERAETPVPLRESPPPRSPHRPRALVPFGIDLRTTTVFAFDLDTRDARGECEVVCWINDLGLRCANFEACLETLLDLCRSELDALIERAVA
jgi:hypothetical protein